jgi:DNA-binding transcriptional regulator YdaS (Cro superfamily)
MEIGDLFDEKKTTYTIADEHGEKSTITIDKWAADLLQESLPDVHQWIQSKYDLVCSKKPQLTRREKGNVVRALARKEAEKSPHYKSLSDFL